LTRLKELAIRRIDRENVWPSIPVVVRRLPACVAQATGLEVLDLRGCQDLELRKTDAGVLRQLPHLRRLEVAKWQGPLVMAHLAKCLPGVELVK
jgi:hypothetical protein